MGMLLGASDLGLTTNWRFRFVPFGFRAETTPGVVFVDVGGSPCPGVVDHHSGGDGDCAASAVQAHRESVYNHLLGPWLAKHPDGKVPPGTTWRPTIVTHAGPDWDALVATWLVVRLVEDGDLPEDAAALIAYSREVDQGRFRLGSHADRVLAPHLAYLAIQHLGGRQAPASDEETLARGFRLLKATMDAIRAEAGHPPRHPSAFLPGSPGATTWSTQAGLAEVAKFLRADEDKFKEDVLARSADWTDIELPESGGTGTLRVPAWVATRPTKSALNKYWVRAADTPLFVCPYEGTGGRATPSEGPDTVFPRVVVSLDPSWSVSAPGSRARRPSLRGLGYALEKAEAEKRKGLGPDADRGGPPRFPGGYCDNRDPWYDGRGHDWTIVDAPACGTRLTYREVLDVVAGKRFWEVPLESSELTLVWVGQKKGIVRAGGDGKAVAFPGMISTLNDYARDTRDFPAAPLPGVAPDAACEISARIRSFPEGTCGPMTIVTLRTGPGATVEGLVRRRDDVVRALGGEPQDYTYARIRFAAHFSDDTAATSLVRSLVREDVAPHGSLSNGGEIVLFNSRAVLVHSVAPLLGPEDVRSDLEVLLYCAFVNETLISFSEDLSRQLGPSGNRLAEVDTEALLARMLAFQTRHYQLEVSRLPRAHTLHAELWQALRLTEHYAETQSELARLASVEAGLADRRASTAARILELFLAILAVAGVLQTVIAFFTLDAAVRRLPSLWWTIGAVLLLSTAVLAGAAAFRRRRSPARRRAAS